MIRCAEFWMEETDRVGDRGGAFGFNTETGPGPAIPTIESLTQILPKEHLWPVDDWWNFHAGLHDFKDIRIFSNASTFVMEKPQVSKTLPPSRN